MLALSAGTLLAQNPAKYRPRNPHATVTIIHGPETSADSVKQQFEENAPAIPSDEGIPRFAIVGKDRLFYLGIGADLRLKGNFDWGDENPSDQYFIPSSFTPATPGNRSDLSFTAAESNIYLNIIAFPHQKHRFSLFFLASFQNPHYGLKVKHIYGKYLGLTIGYTTQAFQDDDAKPYTIDSQGPNGTIFYRTETAFWEQDFGKGFSGCIGINAPGASMTYSNAAIEVKQRAVAVPLWVQYRWGDGSHVRASALIRPLQYRDEAAGKNRGLCGWGAQISGLASLTPQLCLYYNVVGGQGITDYFNDGYGIGGDATPSVTKYGHMDLSKALGWYAGMSYNFTPRLAFHGVYSWMRVFPDKDCMAPSSDYRYGQYVAANLIYDINRFVKVGLEYNWGKRKAVTDNVLHVNRLQALFSLAF